MLLSNFNCRTPLPPPPSRRLFETSTQMHEHVQNEADHHCTFMIRLVTVLYPTLFTRIDPVLILDTEVLLGAVYNKSPFLRPCAPWWSSDRIHCRALNCRLPSCLLSTYRTGLGCCDPCQILLHCEESACVSICRTPPGKVVLGVAARVYAVSKNKYPRTGTFGSKSLDVTQRVIAFMDCTYEPQDIISKTLAVCRPLSRRYVFNNETKAASR